MSDSKVTTEVTELPESRVRLDVSVAPAEVERALEQAAVKLGRNLKLPGFRKGKIPAPVVLRRVGREAVLDEAVRDRLGDWYVVALEESSLHTVGDPQIKMEDLPAAGEPFAFSIEIGVRPTATLGEWKGLEVPRREAAADEEEVTRRVEELRERAARLETVERPAAEGDFIVMDYEGTIDGEPLEGASAHDQLLELGSGKLIPGFEDGLLGAGAGDERTLDLKFPDEYHAEQIAGKDVRFEVTVKEVKEKQLPELDDDFAADAAGFDTLEELREDIRTRLLETDEEQVDRDYREAALDAAVATATVTVPEGLVQARAHEAWERTLHTLSHRGLSKEVYLQITQKTEEEIIAESLPDAELSLRRESVVAALIDAEQIEPSDEQLVAALQEGVTPDQSGRLPEPDEMLATLRKNGRLDELRQDVAAKMAVDAVVSAAKPIAPSLAEAREKLWTPS